MPSDPRSVNSGTVGTAAAGDHQGFALPIGTRPLTPPAAWLPGAVQLGY